MLGEEARASAVIGLIGVLLLLAFSVSEYDSLLSGISLSNNIRTAVNNAVRASLETGGAGEAVGEVFEGSSLFTGEVESYFKPRRGYYASEFANDVNLSVSFECGTPACTQTLQGGVSFERDFTALVDAACETAADARPVKCRVSFSETRYSAKEPPESFGTASLPLPLHWRDFLNGEQERVLSEINSLQKKNVLEKPFLFWAGKPSQVVSEVVELVALGGIAYGAYSADEIFLFDAQQKYGSKYPDGSASPQEFLSNAKKLAEAKTRRPATEKELAQECSRQMDSQPNAAERGIAKLTALFSGLPICILWSKMGELSSNNLPPVFYAMPEEKSLKERVRLATAIFLLDREAKQGIADVYPAIAAENQFAWLNKTGAQTASQPIQFLKNSRTNFSEIKKRFNADLRISESLMRYFELDGNELRTVGGQRMRAWLKTTRSCDEESCGGTISIESNP